jgi:DNA sulfur modification protein DndD
VIKLRYAIFKNFRGLRDVRLDFATSDESPLTIIRAANYTGKTTLLYGLTWALFGDAGLPVAPRRRDSYRLHPIDWDVTTDGTEVQIEVEVGLTVLDERTGVPTDFTLVRRGRETIDEAGWRPHETTYQLVRHDLQGDVEVVDADRFMDRVLLPPAKKDIFFVDGDARVNQYFSVESDEDSRSNVKEAVRHLLSLDVVETAHERMGEVLRLITSKMRSQAVGTQAETVAQGLEAAKESLTKAIQEKEDAEADFRDASLAVSKMDSLRSNALAAGGAEAEKLLTELEQARKRENEAERRIPETMASMRRFLNAHELYEQLAFSSVFAASETYERLRNERKIPNVMPDMIRERIAAAVCICGADLSEGTAGHAHLVEELRSVEAHSESRALLGRLANNAAGALQASDSRLWATGADTAFNSWLEAVRAQERETEEIAKLDHRIQARASAAEDLKIANSNLRTAKLARDESDRRVKSATFDVDTYTNRVNDLQKQLDGLTKQASQFVALRAEQQAAEDLKSVLDRAVSVLLGDTIDEVSARMNDLFMRMIAASPEGSGDDDNGVVQEVRLTRDCTIEALGPSGRRLVPKTDLSAAQQQSLTVALIMALIEISGETSPTVIDTPLGRTSGQVRRQFLRETLELDRLRDMDTAGTPVAQKVLIMTPHEIADVEEILEEAAGAVFTLSNSQHFPNQLVNDPGTRFQEVLVCGCGPRLTDYCDVCKRRDWI